MLGAAAAAVVAAGYGAYWWTYERPAEALRADLGRFEARIAELDDAVADDRRVARELEAWAASSLGASRAVVDHRFRAGLLALAAEAGLSGEGLVVNCGTPSPLRNPAVLERVSEFRGRSELRDAADGYVVDGDVRGRGSYEAGLRLVGLAQAQPWISRVTEASIRPSDDGRQVFDVRVGVRTTFVPDLAPADPEGVPAVERLDERTLLAIERMVAGNVFIAPPPPPAPAAAVPEQPAVVTPRPAPPPPYDEWTVVGVSESATTGDLAWLLGADGTRRFVAVGESVFALTLVDIEGELSVWVEGEAEVVVRMGERLDARSRR